MKTEIFGDNPYKLTSEQLGVNQPACDEDLLEEKIRHEIENVKDIQKEMSKTGLGKD